MKWRCVKPGHWMAKVDGWEWHAWSLAGGFGWECTGWHGGLDGDMWSHEVQSLAEARKVAAEIMAQWTVTP